MENPQNSPENLETPARQMPKRAKPTVEGINAPRVTNKVVVPGGKNDFEKAGSGKEKIFLPSMAKKSHTARNFILTIIVLGAVGCGGYLAYRNYWPGLEPKIFALWQEAPAAAPEPENPKPADSIYDFSDFGSIKDRQEEPAASATPPLANSASPDATTSSPAIPAPSATEPAKAPAPSGPKLSVNDNSLGYLNVRSEPATTGKILAKIYPGELYAYSETKYDWYKITLPDGQAGWVSGTYVTKQ